MSLLTLGGTFLAIGSEIREFLLISNDFENQNKVEIKISRIPFQGQGEKIMYACNSKRAPDIARMDIGLIPKFAAGKALMALDDLGLKNFSSELLEAALDAGRVYLPGLGTRSYAVPDEFTTLALYYNKEMFSNAGLNPTRPPKSWKEVVDYARKLTKDLDGDGKVTEKEIKKAKEILSAVKNKDKIREQLRMMK